MSSPRASVVLSVRVEYDPRRGDADSIASALDLLLSSYTGGPTSDPIDALQDYGVVGVGAFVPDPVPCSACGSGCARAR